MNIISHSSLSETQQGLVIELHEHCAQADGAKIPLLLTNEINFNRTLPCFFGGWEEGRLVAFLGVFMPSRHEGEVVAFTAPERRRQGWFGNLFAEAAGVLKEAGVGEVLFVLNAESETGRAVVRRYGAEDDHRELRMTWSGETAPPAPDLAQIPVTRENSALAVATLLAYTPMEEQEGEAFVDLAIRAADRRAFLVTRRGKAVGGYMVNKKPGGERFLYALGILPEERGKGYGKQLMGLALGGMEPGAQVSLDVDAENVSACRLYKSSGFEVRCQTDYFRYRLP